MASLGNSWDVSQALMDELDEFTCALYGRQNIKHVDDLRYLKLSEVGSENQRLNPSKNVDLASVPPCRRSLENHIRRVHYQAGVWKMANMSNITIPATTDNNGRILVGGNLEPLWFDGRPLPESLAEVCRRCETDATDDSDSDCEDDENEPGCQDCDSVV